MKNYARPFRIWHISFKTYAVLFDSFSELASEFDHVAHAIQY